jgi:predicted GNAT family N-acyltransferase
MSLRVDELTSFYKFINSPAHQLISYAMYEVKRFSFKDTALTKQAFSIRTKVFVEEEGIDAGLEYEHEEESHYYLLLLGEKALATARWRETEEGIKLERFAVLPEFRNRGLGGIILREVLKDVIPLGKTVYLHSQLRAVPFYERCGFKKEGGIIYEAKIGHYFMKLKIEK